MLKIYSYGITLMNPILFRFLKKKCLQYLIYQKLRGDDMHSNILAVQTERKKLKPHGKINLEC